MKKLYIFFTKYYEYSIVIFDTKTIKVIQRCVTFFDRMNQYDANKKFQNIMQTNTNTTLIKIDILNVRIDPPNIVFQSYTPHKRREGCKFALITRSLRLNVTQKWRDFIKTKHSQNSKLKNDTTQNDRVLLDLSDESAKTFHCTRN